MCQTRLKDDISSFGRDLWIGLLAIALTCLIIKKTSSLQALDNRRITSEKGVHHGRQFELKNVKDGQFNAQSTAQVTSEL